MFRTFNPAMLRLAAFLALPAMAASPAADTIHGATTADAPRHVAVPAPEDYIPLSDGVEQRFADALGELHVACAAADKAMLLKQLD